jgi:N-acetyl-anhydromuramyl-L-alanine amidase AmpD
MLQPHYASQGLREIYVGFDSPDATSYEKYMLKMLLIAQLLAPAVLNKPLRSEKKIRSTTANYIVLHYDEGGSYKSTRRALIKKGNSYHYYIQRDGTIIKLIDPKYEAAHAGISYYKGKVRLNKYSIGICLQNDPPQTYTEKQYSSAAWLINELQHRYKDSTTKVLLGHSDIAFPRGRKVDPGEHFNWEKLRININKWR